MINIQSKGFFRWDSFFDKISDSIYTIGYRKCLNEKDTLLYKDRVTFKYLKPTERFWYADPLMYKNNEVVYVFMEVYDRIKDKGMIGVSELCNGENLSNPVIILEEEYHLSFPMVFKWGEDIFMIPETSECGAIVVYKAEKFPYKWSLYKKFDNRENHVDSIVHIMDTNIALIITSINNPANKLQTKTYKYILKKMNDDLELIDIYQNKSSNYSYAQRNGGKLLEENGEVYRIVQVSTRHDYGVAIDIWKQDYQKDIYNDLEIVRHLDKDNIIVKINKILNRIDGIHTYGIESQYEVIDIKLRRVNVLPLLKKIQKRMKMIRYVGEKK